MAADGSECPQTLRLRSVRDSYFRAFSGRGLERFCLQFPVLLQKNFHLSFCFFQFLTAGSRELHPFFKKLQRLLQWHIALLKFLNDLLQSSEDTLQTLANGIAPALILLQFQTL